MDCLPDEVLLDVFDCYRLVVLYDPKYHMRLYMCWPWKTLAHVCRHWRLLVTASPRRLELRLLLTYHSPVVDILEYSPPLPLALAYHDYRLYDFDDSGSLPWPPYRVNSVILALEHIHRIHDITLWAPRNVWSELLPAMTRPALHLESLNIYSDDAIPLPPAGFLSGNAPSLRTVTLNNIFWDSAISSFPQASHIVNFNFWLDKADGADNFWIGSLIEALCTMPRLEELFVALVSGPPGPKAWPLPSTARSSLSALASVTYRGPSTHFEFLIQRIGAPQLDTLSITFIDATLSSAVPSFTQFISGAPKLLVPSVARMGLSLDTSYLQIVSSAQNYEAISLMAYHYMPVALDMTPTASLYRSLAPVLSLTTSLSIKNIGDADETTSNWSWPDGVGDLHTVFGAFNQVTNLYIDNASTPYTIQALQRSGAPTLLPCLQEVELVFYDNDRYSPFDTVAELQPFVAARKDANYPVEGRKHPALKDRERSASARSRAVSIGRGRWLWDDVIQAVLSLFIESRTARHISSGSSVGIRDWARTEDEFTPTNAHIRRLQTLASSCPDPQLRRSPARGCLTVPFALAPCVNRPSGHKLLPNLRDLKVIFYTDDALGPSDVSVELEPIILVRNAGVAQSVKVSYKENWDLDQLADQPPSIDNERHGFMAVLRTQDEVEAEAQLREVRNDTVREKNARAGARRERKAWWVIEYLVLSWQQGLHPQSMQDTRMGRLALNCIRYAIKGKGNNESSERGSWAAEWPTNEHAAIW
ncbi:hypothetical protein BC834DRAFT_847248 [Gloeopeniophorella convolvens]|nr:hypothetical protein BC834DRAFT_847248 [Gloeopeniophorella convolvens]